MKYKELPDIYKKVVSEKDLEAIVDRGKCQLEGLEDEQSDLIYETIFNQIKDVVKSLKLDGPDDNMCSAWLETDSYTSVKQKKISVILEIKGSFQFCVYGCAQQENAIKKLIQAMESYKFDGFRVEDMHQPEDTPGISFNGIYQTEDTKYITGKYKFDYEEIDYE